MTHDEQPDSNKIQSLINQIEPFYSNTLQQLKFSNQVYII